VTWFNRDEGFGFIAPDPGGEDILVRGWRAGNYNMLGDPYLTVGDRVYYEVEWDDGGLGDHMAADLPHTASPCLIEYKRKPPM
jgi:cold shock CspA family protein